MIVPSDFHFSQSSLQDYVDCKRRFQLRHLWQLAWPAVEATPVDLHERLLRLGGAFHLLIQQHIMGMPKAQLSRSVTDDDLGRWWHNYLDYPLKGLPQKQRSEVLVSSPVAGQRLVAKYDLVAIEPGERAVIVDWKTARRRPARSNLFNRLQTRVYRYLLVHAGHHLNDGVPFLPEQVEMIYWFADHPKEPESFEYLESQYREDGAFIISLIEEIFSLEENEFPLTTEERRCRFCPYRSLCQRGIIAGPIEEWSQGLDGNEDQEFELDFDQIAEIEF